MGDAEGHPDSQSLPGAFDRGKPGASDRLALPHYLRQNNENCWLSQLGHSTVVFGILKLWVEMCHRTV